MQDEAEAQRRQERENIGPGMMEDGQRMTTDGIEMMPDKDRNYAASQKFSRSYADSVNGSGSEPGSVRNPAGVVFGGWIVVRP
jgi:hypothetical protein